MKRLFEQKILTAYILIFLAFLVHDSDQGKSLRLKKNKRTKSVNVRGCIFCERPVVTTSTGQIRGEETSQGAFQKSYFSFKGIPYAEPPVGTLRWRNPVPHKGWTGIREATEFGNHCPNKGSFYIGNYSLNFPFDLGGFEDCLFLNVYSPDLGGSNAVIVFIHAGSFTAQSGNSWIYGPRYLVLEGVVLVTLNYRLGAFGFMSTGDAAAQGNYGLKDQLEAIRWVKKNIAAFGGDPNKITIYGESAGSVSVNYHIISDMRSDLFQQAITQSGSALCPWAFQPNPRQQAFKLGRNLGLTWTSTQDLVDQLRKVPFGDILTNTPSAPLSPPAAGKSFEFVPCVEPPDSPEPRFLSKRPEKIYRSGNFTPLPYLTGMTTAESIAMVYEPVYNTNVFKKYRKRPELYVPLAYKLNKTTDVAEINEVAVKFKQIYFNGSEPSISKVYKWAQYHSDNMFNFPGYRTARYHAQKTDFPVYSYVFGMATPLNLVKNILGLYLLPGASHADDLFYTFDPEFLPYPILSTDSADLTRQRLVRMLTNFAKFGDPTPNTTDPLIKVKWPKLTVDSDNYLNINKNLKPLQNRFDGRLAIWQAFLERFNP